MFFLLELNAISEMCFSPGRPVYSGRNGLGVIQPDGAHGAECSVQTFMSSKEGLGIRF